MSKKSHLQMQSRYAATTAHDGCPDLYADTINIPFYLLEQIGALHNVPRLPKVLLVGFHCKCAFSPLGPFEITNLLLGPVLCSENLELSGHSRPLAVTAYLSTMTGSDLLYAPSQLPATDTCLPEKIYSWVPYTARNCRAVN
jgi:hypothetical protein